MTTALLVIDMQQALCAGPEAAFDIARVLERINALVADARATGVPVIFVQHEEPEGPFMHGSEGWQLADGLIALPQESRFRKTTPDAFHRTDLLQHLQTLHVTHLVICGLQSDCCITATTSRALALGFDTTLVSDAHSTVDGGGLSAAQIIAHTNWILAGIGSYGPRIRVVPAREVRMSE